MDARGRLLVSNQCIVLCHSAQFSWDQLPNGQNIQSAALVLAYLSADQIEWISYSYQLGSGGAGRGEGNLFNTHSRSIAYAYRP